MSPSHSRATDLVNNLGDQRVTVGALLLGQPPRTSHSSSVPCAIELPNAGVGPSRGAPCVSVGATGEDRMSIVASESGLLSSGEDDEAVPPGWFLMLNRIQS